MSSLPRQRRVTEFYNKNGLSLFLMGQEETHKPSVAQRGYPKKFWGLFGEVAHIAQENLMIGQFAKMNTFHWSRYPLQYLKQLSLSPTKLQQCTLLHIHIQQPLRFSVQILGHFLQESQDHK